jgi:hypothetical protein
MKVIEPKTWPPTSGELDRIVASMSKRQREVLIGIYHLGDFGDGPVGPYIDHAPAEALRRRGLVLRHTSYVSHRVRFGVDRAKPWPVELFAKELHFFQITPLGYAILHDRLGVERPAFEARR